ncbi:AsmA family protein [Hyphomicrobium sp. D-2]|uniref:AsmA family protein n=1 Tax=Hyphomicrobium sp. D-2 TaxID=3041621 RepID=UPI0024576EF9|nr:AsmA family protein [Hyphomicrobium sp. D-2]MDH4982326.1 AsmA family protein [Hyphomicrobium sp. D-2]
MTNTRPPGRGSPHHPQRPVYPANPRGQQAYGANLPHGFAGERRPIQPPPPRRGSPIRSLAIFGGLALVVVGGGAAAFLAMSPPTDLLQREIIAAVKRETGRDLVIGGGASFTLFPSAGVRLNDVSLSPPPGMEGEPLVRMTSFDVGVRLLPLLSQQVVVDRVELNNPVFVLRVDADGRRSWDMAAVSGHDVPALPGSEGRRLRFGGPLMRSGGLMDLIVSPAHAAAPGPAAISLNEIVIHNGALRYQDDRNGAWGRFDGLNAHFSMPAMDAPLNGSGLLMADGEKFSFKTQLTTPADLAAQKPAKLALSISGTPLSLTYDGTVGGEQGAGSIVASSPSLSAFANWWSNGNAKLPPQLASGEVTFSANMNANPQGVAFSAIEFKAGPAAAKGSASFADRAGERPLVTADLAVSGLDFAVLSLAADLRQTGSGAAQAAAPRPTPLSFDDLLGPGEKAGEEQGSPQSIEELLNAPHPGPRVQGYTRRAGWSDEPIDIKALGLADANVRLALANVTYKETRIDRAQVNISVRDMVAKVNLADAQLYGGTGKGVITLDASSPQPAFSSNIDLAGVDAGPMLRDAAEVDWVSGRANVAWNVSGTGNTEAALVASLNGTSQASIRDGAVAGFDIGSALGALANGSVPNLERDPSRRTPFRSLTGTFTITNGVASNNDLQLDSPHVHASGDGTVNLSQRTLDYTLRPKLVADLGGDGGERNALGIEVPVRITGPLDEPRFAPDIAGALNSQGTVDAVKEIGRQLKGKNAGEVVKDLFGKEEGGGPSKAEKLLEGLFGRQ